MSKKLNLLILTGTVAVLSAGGAATLTGRSLAQSSTENYSASVSAADGSTLLDQTIYVFTDASGKVRRTVSSDWTRSLDTDKYTKVETTKKTPIELSVKYTLDSKEVSASDIAGKSGKVTIEFNYNNTEKSGGYYVPYAVMTGLILDNDVFKNVEVDGGRIFNDGSRTVVAGVALPGMQENLDISEDTFNVPKSLKITADATNFELGMTMSLATTEVFADLDTDGLDSLDSIAGQISTLESAMAQLIDGSSQLYDGIAELNDKSGILVEGINQLAAGGTELKTGIASADSGVASLQSGLSAISDNFNLLTENNDGLTAGASQTFDSLITNAHDLIEAKVNAATYATALSKLADAVKQYTAAGVATPAEVLAQLPAEQVTIPAFTQANYEAILTGLAQQYPDYAADFTTAKVQLNYYRDNFLAGINDYTAGAAAIAAAIDQQVIPGVDALKGGTEQLYAGASALSDGLAELNNGTPSLVSGISQLKNGSGQLRDGITQLNDEGIQKIVDVYGDVEAFANRLRDIVNVAKNSNTNVKYIYRTDEIKK